MKKLLLGAMWFGAAAGLVAAMIWKLGLTSAGALWMLGASAVLGIGIGAARGRRGWARWIAVSAVCGAAVAVGVGLRQPQAPAEIMDFVRRYPEAHAFAENYAAEHGKRHSIDLMDELSGGGIPLFIQWDRRWGYERYGTNYFGVNGCGPTCLSMVACALTGDAGLDPLTVARLSEAKGWYASGVGTSWALMTDGAEALGLNAGEGEISEAYIREHLSRKTPMICSMRPGDFTDGGHFIVLTGVDEDGGIRVNDPNSPANSARSWPADVLVEQIKGIWRYSA